MWKPATFRSLGDKSENNFCFMTKFAIFKDLPVILKKTGNINFFSLKKLEKSPGDHQISPPASTMIAEKCTGKGVFRMEDYTIYISGKCGS